MISLSLQQGLSALHLIASDGNLDIMRKLLEDGASLNIASKNSEETPLMLAVLNGQHEAAQLLLDRECNVNAVSGQGDQIGATALHLAAQSGDDMMVDLLINRKARTNAARYTSEITGITPLHDGAESGNKKCIQVIILYVPLFTTNNLDSREHDLPI